MRPPCRLKKGRRRCRRWQCRHAGLLPAYPDAHLSACAGRPPCPRARKRGDRLVPFAQHGEPEFDSLLPRIVRPLREAQGAAGKIDPAVALDIVLYGRTRIPRAVDVASEGGDKPGDVGLATGAAELLDALGLDVLVVLPLRDEGWVDLERAHAKIARAVQ